METKFTKGKWKLANNEYGFFTSVRNLDDSRKICTSRVNNQTESNANMLLISKAPEMFEMLKELLMDIDEIEYHTSMNNTIVRAKQLLKEATEI